MKIINIQITTLLLLVLGITNVCQAKDLASVKEERSFQRAKEAVLWSQPVMGVAMTLQAIEENGGKVNDIVYLSKPSNWKWRILTPNSQSLYVTGVFKTSLDAPLVIEVPARSKKSDIFGTIMDSFQVPLADVGSKGDDKGKGAKYVLVPPGFKGSLPKGAIEVKTERNFAYIMFRVIPKSFSEADLADAKQVVKGIKSYPLGNAKNQGSHIDVYDKMFDTVAPEDDSYFDILTNFLNKETITEKDMLMMGMMQSFGYLYGEKFAPSDVSRKMLNKARIEALDDLIFMMRDIAPNLWKGKAGWTLPVKSIGPKTGFSWKTNSAFETDARAETYALYCCAPVTLGAASAYILATRDINGQPLDASKNYKLHVPANVPVKQFWALTAYDAKSAAFFKDVKETSVGSLNKNVVFNDDGSIDLYVGPKAPKGNKTNWIETNGTNNSLFLFRFYGPTKALSDGSWTMNGFETYND